MRRRIGRSPTLSGRWVQSEMLHRSEVRALPLARDEKRVLFSQNYGLSGIHIW
jgi:hypothetical protein